MTPDPVDPRDAPLHDIEARLGDIAQTIQKFALLQFDARAAIGPAGDLIDAVAAGVNFLGEELGAAYGEIERRVTERTAELAVATRELRRRALHDELTGLPNRTLFWDRLNHRLSQEDRRAADFAVLFVDLDQFKDVNDELGHAAGDHLLIDVTARIRAALREGDSAARMGGDEFLVLLDEVVSSEAAVAVAERLIEALRAPHQFATDERVVTTSIGVAIGPGDFTGADSLVAAADAAMYEAKRAGKDRCVLYRGRSS